MPEVAVQRSRAAGRAMPLWAQRLIWPALALALLLLFNIIFTPGFLKIEMIDGRLSGYLVDIFRDGAAVMLLAIGMTLVIATGGIDLSVGAVMAIAAVVSASLVTPQWLATNLGPWAVEQLEQHQGRWLIVVVGASLLVSMIAGAWNGLLVAVLRVQPIIATLILMVAGRGVAQLISKGAIFTYNVPSLSYIGKGVLGTLPFSLWIVAAFVAATHLLTRRTALGLFIEAVGDNDTASRYTGIHAATVKFMAYVFCGLCAGMAGLIESTNISSANANQIGLYYELDAIFAVVVGGTALTGGRYFLFGSIVGAVLIQTLTNTMYAQQVSADIAPLPKAVVIVLVALLQSQAFRAKVIRPISAVFRGRGRGRRRAVA